MRLFLLSSAATFLLLAATGAQAASLSPAVKAVSPNLSASSSTPITSSGRPHEVRGTVRDADDNQPLPGVNVLVKGTTSGTSTGSNGEYEITAPTASDTLVFSFVGYQSKEVPIDGRSEVNVTLQPELLEAQEVVVTGYQVQREESLTGAVSVVDTAALQDTPTDNVVESLQGRVAGMRVTTSGMPGGDPTVRIRGLSTLNNNDPLYIVDGVPTKSGVAQTLNSETIESVQVLKDAASASIYGARASNGVIVITTKNGGEENFEVSYSANATASYLTNTLDPLSTEERGRVLWQAAINDGADPATIEPYDYEWHRQGDGTAVLDDIVLPEYVGPPSNGIRPANTNWYDEISRTGVIQNHKLQVTAGSERGSALLSLRYHDNEGVVKETGFRRLSARINSDYDFFDDRLTVGENLTVSHDRQSPMPSGLGGNPLDLAIISQPILPVRTEDGGWAGPSGAGFDDRDNPMRLIEHNRWDKESTFRTFGNVFAEFEPLEDVVSNTRLGVDYARGSDRYIQRTYQSGFLSRDFNSLRNTETTSLDWTLSSTLEYSQVMNSHSVNILAGTELVESEFESTGAYREGFATESLDYFVQNAGTGKQTVSGFRTGYSLLSFFGKADYSYDDRYLASVTLRRDGSSRFGENHQFGFFPAFSAGWRFAEESFVADNLGFLSSGKLRVSWGKVGNQEIANDARFTIFRPNYGDEDIAFVPSNGTAYDIGGIDSGNLPSGFRRTQLGNDDLKWEETTELNLGLDFGFADDRLTGEANVYSRTTEDILIQPPYIAVRGEGGAQWLNGATVQVRGFEFQTEYTGQMGDFDYSVSGNVGAYRDEITELPDDVVDSYPGNSEKTIIGHSQNSHFGYVVDGIFETEAEVEAHAEQPGKDVGRLRYADLNDDGVINSLDQKYQGTTTPDFEYGFNTRLDYKSFSLSVFLQGVYGPEVYSGHKTYTDFTSFWNGANYGSRTLDAWTPQNQDTRIPALSLSDQNNEDRPSSYFIEDGSYLKLRNLQVGYELPKSFAQKLRAKRLHLYVRGENLFTIADRTGADAFTGADPENPYNVYPRPRTFTIGANLTFF